mmetsp:Transcript_34004/g.104400  ORF Transcript_34004/g.104400 Transcript_34004/m.104400 type:complete len:255 (-) Transcript_34004:379-1143(-)
MCTVISPEGAPAGPKTRPAAARAAATTSAGGLRNKNSIAARRKVVTCSGVITEVRYLVVWRRFGNWQYTPSRSASVRCQVCDATPARRASVRGRGDDAFRGDAVVNDLSNSGDILILRPSASRHSVFWRANWRACGHWQWIPPANGNGFCHDAAPPTGGQGHALDGAKRPPNSPGLSLPSSSRDQNQSASTARTALRSNARHSDMLYTCRSLPSPRPTFRLPFPPRNMFMLSMSATVIQEWRAPEPGHGRNCAS